MESLRDEGGSTGGSAVWWYTARVENYQGIHGVFYARTRPKIGDTCGGVASPNRIIGYRRELAPYTLQNVATQPRDTTATKQDGR